MSAGEQSRLQKGRPYSAKYEVLENYLKEKILVATQQAQASETVEDEVCSRERCEPSLAH